MRPTKMESRGATNEARRIQRDRDNKKITAAQYTGGNGRWWKMKPH